MNCIFCGSITKTTNSRKRIKNTRIWRRHKCMSCQGVFTSNEEANLGESIKVNSFGVFRPFIREKLMLSVYQSISHRKTALEDVRSLVSTIIVNLLPCPSGVLESEQIQEETYKVLKRFDKPSAIHYKAHHKS